MLAGIRCRKDIRWKDRKVLEKWQKCTAPRLAVKVIHTSRAAIKSSDTVYSVRDALPSTGQTCGKEVASSATAPCATLRAALSKDSSTSVILS